MAARFVPPLIDPVGDGVAAVPAPPLGLGFFAGATPGTPLCRTSAGAFLRADWDGTIVGRYSSVSSADQRGVTGQAIIKAILGGQRDPHKLAEFRNPRADFAAIEEILTRMGKSATSGKPLQDGARNQSSRSPKSIHALIFAKRAPVSKLPT